MASAAGGPKDFAFRRLRTPEEFRHAEELQREALGPEEAVALPAPLLRTVQDNGGLVLGAFADIYLAGCVVSTIGWDGTTLYHQANVTVVRPAYQKHRLGFRLGAYLRDEVLGLGLPEVRWSFDPLSRPGASLSVRRFGARPDAFHPNYYGQLLGGEGPRDESDRLHVRWRLSEATVARRLAGALPSAEEDRARHAGATPLVETELGESGLRLPTAVAEPAGPDGHLEVPFDLASIRAHEPASLRRWRHAVRDALRAAFDLGYAIDDFATIPIEHERRSFYLLRRAAENAPPGPVGA